MHQTTRNATENTNEKKQGMHIIFVTIAVIIALAVFITTMIKVVDNTVMQGCFENLKVASEGLAKDLREASEQDQAVLAAISNVIENEDDLSDEHLTMLLNCYDLSSSYLSYIELFRPDNTILDPDGTVRDVSGRLDFAAEAQKGKIISGIGVSTKDGETKVIRNAVPVMKNGEVIFILYGTIQLTDFSKEFTVDAYNGEAEIFIEDGDTGEFILDTWHKSLGVISDFVNRKTLPGYSWKAAISDMEQGKSGCLSFVSNTLNDVVCIYYAPSGIGNWNVMVMIPQEIALEENQIIRTQLYIMAAVVGIVILGYMIFITAMLRQSYKKVKKIGLEDQNTGLSNRNAYDAFMAENAEKRYTLITCVFIDVNGLHEINNQYGHAAGDHLLRTVADTLKEKFPQGHLYRIGGDEFVVFL